MAGRFALRTVEVVHPPTERFAQFLQARGKRLTPQRRLIVEQVFSHHDHFDADELIDHLQPLLAARRKLSRPDGLPHAGRTGRGGPAAEDDPGRPQRLRARLRLPQPRPPLLPASATGSSSSTAPSWNASATPWPRNTTSRSPATACSSPACAPRARGSEFQISDCRFQISDSARVGVASSRATPNDQCAAKRRRHGTNAGTTQFRDAGTPSRRRGKPFPRAPLACRACGIVVSQ